MNTLITGRKTPIIKTKFEVFTTKDYKWIPKNMVFIKDETGWMFLQNELSQWFVNHTNTFNAKSKETNEEVIKSIVKQIKINKKMLAND